MSKQNPAAAGGKNRGGVFRTTAHMLRYGVWLMGQIIKESVVMAVDTLGTGRRIAPVVIYYPLRITRERDIAALTASITMTPGTLALGVTGSKELDDNPELTGRSTWEAFRHGVADVPSPAGNTQRYLAVHAMYGADPLSLLEGFADMEARLVPSVAARTTHYDVKHLVERGRPGPRGFRGSRGGRAHDVTAFDVEKVDSTPHAAAFVAAVLQDEPGAAVGRKPHGADRTTSEKPNPAERTASEPNPAPRTASEDKKQGR